MDADGRILGIRTRHDHQPGRVPARAEQPAGAARDPVRDRRLPHPRPRGDRDDRLHHHHPDRRVSWGRPPGGGVHRRAADGRRRPRARDRPGRDPPPQLPPANRLPAPHPERRQPTTAATTRGCWTKLVETAGYAQLRAQQAERRARGELVGIGLATFIENTSAGWESGAVRVESDGSITVISGAIPMGQGVDTVLAQIVADALGVSRGAADVPLRGHGADPGGDGLVRQPEHGHRRQRRPAGGAPRPRARDRPGRPAAGDRPRTTSSLPDGRGVRAGRARAAGRLAADRAAAYPAIGRPVAEEPGLEAHAFFGTDGEAIAAGAYLAVVSIDRETGQVKLEQLIAVDDSGTVINPLLAEGQIHGAMAQGIGEALQERVVYDADGQLVTASLLDYALPTAGQVVSPVTDHIVTPSPLNPLGAKGMGEAGIIGTPPAIINAAIDALAPLGVRHLDPPLHAEKIWRILRDAQATERPPDQVSGYPALRGDRADTPADRDVGGHDGARSLIEPGRLEDPVRGRRRSGSGTPRSRPARRCRSTSTTWTT